MVAVKIDNAPGARPQSGLSTAGIVYEHETEGSVTRYTAFFLDSELPRVGPVRSARFVDRDLVQQFDALFAHVGGSQAVLKDLRASPVADMDEFFYSGHLPYVRVSGRPPPFNCYADLSTLRHEGARRYDNRREIGSLMFYGQPHDSGPIRSLTVPRGGRTTYQVEYRYQPLTRRWQRLLGGIQDIDAATGVAIAVENIVIQHAPIRITEVVEDSLGSRSLAIPTTGSGPVSVFRDGLRFDGTWERNDAKKVTRFRTASGTQLHLRPGRTWVHLLDIERQVDSV